MDVVAEVVEVAGHELGEGEGWVLDEGGEVDGPVEAGVGVGGAGVVEGGVGLAAGEGGGVVGFGVFDLGLVGGDKLPREFGVGVGWERQFVGEPVEGAPDFAAEDFCREFVGGEFSEGAEGVAEDRDVGVVFVGGVVEVEGLEFWGGGEDGLEVGGDVGVARVFGGGAGVGELDLGGVFSEVGGLSLFVAAGCRDGGVVGAGGDDDAGEVFFGVLVALGDAVVGHDFDVVGVGGDAEVGGACEGVGGRQLVGDVDVGGGLGEVHGVCCFRCRFCDWAAAPLGGVF